MSVGLQKGDGLSRSAVTSGATLTVVTTWANLPTSPSNGDYAYISNYGLFVVYLAAISLWVPPVFVESGALSAQVKILIDGSSITGLDDDDPVDTWPNLGSAGGSFEGTTTERPLYKETGGPSGGPGVLGDGVDDVMYLGDGADLGVFRNATLGFLACLVKPAGVSAADRNVVSVAYGAGVPAGEARAAIYHDTIVRAGGRRDDGDAFEAASISVVGTLPAVDEWIAYGAVFDWAEGDLHVVAGTQKTYSYGIRPDLGSSNGSTSDTDAQEVSIFDAPDYGLPTDGTLAQVWAVEGTLGTRGNLNTLLRYMEAQADL